MAVSGRVLITLFFTCGLLQSAAATMYTVGGSAGWTKQSKTSTLYEDQFKDILLNVGDILYFGWTVNADANAVMIPEANVATCDSSTVIDESPSFEGVTGSFQFPLSKPGTYGIICDMSDSCSEYGMHFIVTVQAPVAPVSPPTTNVSPPTTNAPSHNSQQPDKASVLRSGSAMLIAAVLAGGAVLLL